MRIQKKGCVAKPAPALENIEFQRAHPNAPTRTHPYQESRHCCATARYSKITRGIIVSRTRNPVMHQNKLVPMPLKLFLCTLSLILPILAATSARAETWPPALEASLARAGIPRSTAALLVQDVDAPAPLIAHRSGEAMNPASVMKLVTAYVALERLGPAFNWNTRVAGSANISKQILHGDLFITGGGDPRLSRERLWLLLRGLRAQGIRRISGDVVTDRSFFRLPRHDPAAFDQRPLRPYNAGADALSVDYGAMRIRVVPTPGGAIATSDPLPAGITLDSRIRRTSSVSCGDPTAQLTATKAEASADLQLILEGVLPQGCIEPFDWNIAPLPPDQLFEGVFRTLWQELGGEIDGRFRDGPTPPQARPLARTVSPNLPEVLRDMNKWSNNVIARQVLATLGALAEPGEDSITAGIAVMKNTLTANGIGTAGLVIENGAGLSRSERISADTLGQLLILAWHSRTMPELVSSLPVAGVDGTARRRLPNSPAAGYAHVKTGTLDGVRSLAGYVLARNGHRYAIVLMINHPNAGAARDVQDALIEWVAGL